MKVRHLGISIAIVIALTLALYVTIAVRLLQEPPAPTPASDTPADPVARTAEPSPDADAGGNSIGQTSLREPDQPEITGARKRLEIYGRVTDADGRPIAGVLVAEEKYFQRTRSDAAGYYRLNLELPRHRYPSLHFMRRGYAGQIFKPGKKQLQDRASHELDVKMPAALKSVAFGGRVGDEFGIGLAGARVQLSASYSRNQDSYYLTEFTDDRGYFVFDGVSSDETYKFSVNLTPEYPVYEIPDLHVSLDPPPLEIMLRKLKFVDIDGMILNRNSVPVPNYKMQISNLSTGSHTATIVSDSSGFFSLDSFPVGEVSLTTRGPEFFKITGLEITESAYQNLEIVIDRGDRFLSGWISDANGLAVARGMVTLDRSFDSNGTSNLSYRSQATDANGGFSFAGLGDGSYHVTVYAQGFDKQDFEFRFEDQAGEIHVILQRQP